MTIGRLPKGSFGKGAVVVNIPARWPRPDEPGYPEALKQPKPTAEKPKEGK